LELMSTRRPADTTPDLFSTHAPAKASEPPTAPQERAAAQPRHLLPKDLTGALKQLGDREIDALLSAVTTEAERCGRLSAQRSKDEVCCECKDTSPPSAHRGWRRVTDNGQAERCARCFQGWRQAFRDRPPVRDFTVRCQAGARHRGPRPKIQAVTRPADLNN